MWYAFWETNQINMKRTSRHHVVPISIGGWDIEQNIIFLTPEEHTKLHQIMNISYDSIRTFRKRTNHILFVNEYYVRELALVQEIFFQKLDKIDPFVIELIAESLHKLVLRALSDFRIDRFSLVEKFETPLHKARYMLKSYHAVLLIAVLRKSR